MTNKQHPTHFDWATELSDAQEQIILSAKEANEIGARLRSMCEKLKVYEDLDGAASDVQLLRLGYAAARLKIKSLQAQIKTMAEERADELTVAHLDGRMRAAQPTDAMLGEQAELRRLSDCCPELNLSNYGPDDVDELNGWAIEVSQCIDRALAAQPAGAQQPDTAYAEPPSYEHQRAIMEAERNASLDEYSRIVPLTSTESMIYERAFTNGWNRRASHGQAPAQAAPAYKDSTPELRVGDSAFESWYSTYSPAHKADKQRARDAYAAGMGDPLVMAADSVLEDAARYRWLAAHCRSTSEHWGGRWSIVVEGPAPKSHDSEDDFDEAVDAARAAQKGGA